MNDWLVFNTSKGKDLQGLVEGGASFGTSIRGWGQYNEDTNLTVSETRKLWMTVRSTLKRVVLGEMGHERGPTGAEPIALDILVLVAVRAGWKVDRVLVPVDMRRHRPRTDVLAVKRIEHAKADLLGQLPDAVGVAVIGHGVTLLHGSAGWRWELGGVGRRPLP
jgi:hypothetical protein